MTLMWNEIKARAVQFSENWKDSFYEKRGNHNYFFNNLRLPV
jgi:hypothetical protein